MLKVLLTLLIIAVCIVLILFLIGVAIMHFITNQKRIGMEEGKATEIKKGFWKNYDDLASESWDITCKDGYVLHGTFHPQKDSKKYVIITHGYTYNRYGSVKYANIFYDYGYNVYLYDIRNHGVNEKYYCSMGRNESRDVIEVKDALLKRFGDDITIGLHGESLGCASSTMALAYWDGFEFCVADCGFYDTRMLFKHLSMRLVHLPGEFVVFADIAMKIFHGFTFSEFRPIEAVAKTNVPVLFIHGEDDDFIPPEHVYMGYEACSSKIKRLETFPGANHAQSYEVDTDRYYRIIKEFLETVETH